jgi:hypothetical protein
MNNHGFTLAQVVCSFIFSNNIARANVPQGLAFLGLFVGMILGIISGEVIWTPVRNSLVAKQKAQGGEAGGSEPEYRLPSTIAGAVVVPIALFGQSLQALTSSMSSNHDRQVLLGLHSRRWVTDLRRLPQISANLVPAGALDRYDSVLHIDDVMIADNMATAVPIIFSAIFGIGYGFPFPDMQVSLINNSSLTAISAAASSGAIVVSSHFLSNA